MFTLFKKFHYLEKFSISHALPISFTLLSEVASIVYSSPLYNTDLLLILSVLTVLLPLFLSIRPCDPTLLISMWLGVVVGR